MLSVIAISFLGSVGVSGIIIITTRYHGKYTLDFDMAAVHKFHKVAVPRIGGIALFAGLVTGAIYHGLQADDHLHLSKWAGVAALPVFLGGFFEDVFKKVSPRDRLLLSFLSASIGYYELDIGLSSIDWPVFDENILSQPGVALLLTIFMVAGVAHSTNIIDGFHGLLLGSTCLTLMAFIWVMFQTGGGLLTTFAAIMLGAVLGVFVWNFPKGKIFVGDGGAYLIGFLLSVLALLLVKNRSDVSPWFPLLVLSYPIFETVFSMVRKKIFRQKSVMIPDNYHLHMLVYEIVSSPISKKIGINRNATTSIIIWGFSLFAVIPAVIWWRSTVLMFVFFLVFCVLYSCLYLWLFQKVDSKAF